MTRFDSIDFSSGDLKGFSSKDSATSEKVLLSIALLEFEACGYSITSMILIAEGLGISESVLHGYFVSKAKLFFALVQSRPIDRVRSHSARKSLYNALCSLSKPFLNFSQRIIKESG